MRHLMVWLFRLVATLIAALVLAAGGTGLGASRAYALGPGLACVFNAPHGAGDRGHVGWAYEIGNSGTFVYGAVENPNADEAITKDGSGNFVDYWTNSPTTLGGWSKQGNWSQMTHDFTYQPEWNNSADGWANAGTATPMPRHSRLRRRRDGSDLVSHPNRPDRIVQHPVQRCRRDTRCGVEGGRRL